MANKIARSGDDSRDEMTLNKIVKFRKPNSDKAFCYFFVFLYKHVKCFVGGKYLWILREVFQSAFIKVKKSHSPAYGRENFRINVI